MGILMLWPVLIAVLVWLYDWHAQSQVRRRNERITQAYVDAVERNIQFQREMFEAHQ